MNVLSQFISYTIAYLYPILEVRLFQLQNSRQNLEKIDKI